MSIHQVYEQGEAPQRFPDWLTDASIKAVPLGNVTGDKVKAKPGKENLAFFWAQKNPFNLQRKQYQGFEFATKDDCDVPGVPCINNKFSWMDTILMKIPKALYNGALKHNALKNIASISGADAAAKAEEDFYSQPGASAYRGKMDAVNTDTSSATEAIKQMNKNLDVVKQST